MTSHAGRTIKSKHRDSDDVAGVQDIKKLSTADSIDVAGGAYIDQWMQISEGIRTTIEGQLRQLVRP